ncbi:asparagine synthase B [Candidatus Xianfuyuplasma coldseepsis]|uniref:asparagine synthase (glutamine-hydrolyzing) n=1 Tax=Candidatus Xianfuyuplasma coldseepsis TaxID=2782163 RepID=A0A7L7KPL6_9MOLU|nr:asparagine synthase B [Xianfuyuplasma coldseepsis]QMS84730.1 asparagine synthase B [Xianfuyuplasma coldseepsis]
MCGIIVSTSPKTDALTKHITLQKRGPDQVEIHHVDTIQFGFHRLAIMDLDPTGMQPFTKDGITLVANAEIYNYKSIRSQYPSYPYQSESDCEVLLPLYQEFGVEMFAMLDAEFAVVLYDQQHSLIIAGRDPIGIRPLFYGYHKDDNKIIFASEAKALIDIVDKVHPFPPGHYYIDGAFVKYHTIDEVTDFHEEPFEDIIKHIREKLITGVTKRLDSDAPMGFLLSGGLDSSIVCAIAQKYVKQPIRTFAIGMDTDPIDLKYAAQVAQYIGSDHTEVRITKEDVLSSLKEVIYALETYDITTIRASMGMYLLSSYIHKHTDIKVLQTGEVSDELFGYKYTDFAPTPKAFQDESLKRIRELYQYDVLRADRCLAANSLEARVPFADLAFVQYVLRISPLYKMNKYKMGKYLLRKAFEVSWLPRDIVYREKAAFSDAVGHSLVDELKAFAEQSYSDKDFNIKKKHFTPELISKEALLYREIFEMYYPSHGHLIPGYWMPNKEWDGCDVNDPSARVLANYGDSGK